MNKDIIKFIFADDHPFMRESFTNAFRKGGEIELVATAVNGQDLLNAVQNHQPHVVIVDVKMPFIDGVEATRIIKSKYPHIKVLGFSAYDEFFEDMMEARADGYLLKNACAGTVKQAIKTVLSGQVYFCDVIWSKLQREGQQPERKKPVKNIAFTEKEMEVMKLIAKEKSSTEIAAILSISVRTVETHRQNIAKKIGAKSVIGIALYAHRRGYV